MLVSHAHRFVFLKTRKTASTSVEMALQTFCIPEDTAEPAEKTTAIVSDVGIVGARSIPPTTRRGDSVIWFHHMGADAIADGIGEEAFASYRKVATVRNPFTRIVSGFHYRRRNRNRPPGPEDWDEQRTAFRDWVLSEKWSNDRYIVHRNGRFCVDHAVRFERLQDDLNDLAGTLGLDPAKVALPHTKDNRAARRGRPPAEYFDRDTVDMVRRRLSWVFERFGYPERPEEASAAPGAASDP